MLSDLRRILAVLWLNLFRLALIYALRSHETQTDITKILSWLQKTGLHRPCVRWVMLRTCNKTLIRRSLVTSRGAIFDW